MISRLLKVKSGLLAPILVLVIPFLTFIQTSNPVISLLLLFMICILPGMAILERFNFSFHSLTTRFFYTILFSVFSLMVVFTIFSVTAHAIGITAPLSTYPVKIICIIILLPVSGFLIRRVGDSGLRSLKPFDWVIFIPRLLSLCLPVISLICVLRLNAYSDNTSTAIFLTLLVLFFLILTVNPSRTPNTNLQAWLIFGICSALVLGSTFRGDGGFWGYDINLEFFSASKVVDQGLWLPAQGSSAYDSMLSITVLPVVLSLFSNLSLTIIFKLFYALVLALIPTVLYVWCVKYVSRFSAMVVTGSLILGSISYIPQMSALNRQIIGIAFFIGILLVISENSWTQRRKKVVGLTMAAGMAVSHYSTAYLASLIFAISLVVAFYLLVIARKREVSVKRVFTPAFCISLVLITVFWNGIVHQSIQGIKPIVETTFAQGLNLLPNQDQTLWERWFSGTEASSVSPESSVDTLDSLRVKNLAYGKKIRITPTQTSLSYRLKPSDIPNPAPLFGYKVAAAFDNFIVFGRTFFQLVAALGLFLLFRRNFLQNSSLRRQTRIQNFSQSPDLLSIGVGALIIGLIVRISGTLGPVYNPERAAFQIVIVLLIPSVIAIEYLLFRKRIIQVFLAVPVLFFLVTLLLQATSLGGYVSGSDTSRISKIKSDYSPFIISEGERVASRWLANSVPVGAFVQTDTHGLLTLLQNGRRSNSTSLDPVNLAGNSYIYAANSNVVGQVARAQTLFAFPEDYINQHYRVVYATARARIYH